MKTGGGYLARLAARAATPAVAPQPILFNTEIAAPGLNPPPPPPVPREIALAPPPLPDAHPAAPPTVIAVSRSDPLAGPAESIPAPAPPEVMGQRKPGSPLPRPQVDRPLEAPAKPRSHAFCGAVGRTGAAAGDALSDARLGLVRPTFLAPHPASGSGQRRAAIPGSVTAGPRSASRGASAAARDPATASNRAGCASLGA